MELQRRKLDSIGEERWGCNDCNEIVGEVIRETGMKSSKEGKMNESTVTF